jgi:hypothetical protein
MYNGLNTERSADSPKYFDKLEQLLETSIRHVQINQHVQVCLVLSTCDFVIRSDALGIIVDLPPRQHFSKTLNDTRVCFRRQVKIEAGTLWDPLLHQGIVSMDLLAPEKFV